MPDFVFPSTILVCEAKPFWTPELQRQFLDTNVTVRGCGRWTEMAGADSPPARSLRIVDLEHRTAELLAGMGRDVPRTERPPLIVLASARWSEFEWVLREAGASAFFATWPTGEELARCCRRILNPGNSAA